MDNEKVKEQLKILVERRSIRKFTSKKIPRDILEELVFYAQTAPSACNMQQWRFTIVDNPEVKQRIVDCGGSVLINKAPCGILVSYANTTRNIHYHDDIQTVGASIQNLLLAAHAYDLGACWLCTLPSKRTLGKIFKMPNTYSAAAYIIIGYPASGNVKPIPRKHTVSEIMAYNTFPQLNPIPEKSMLFVWCERFLIWVYGNLPVLLKKKWINKMIDKKFTKKFDN